MSVKIESSRKYYKYIVERLFEENEHGHFVIGPVRDDCFVIAHKSGEAEAIFINSELDRQFVVCELVALALVSGRPVTFDIANTMDDLKGMVSGTEGA